MARAISNKTYKDFMKKYKLFISYVLDGKRYKKTIPMMQKEIYEYELSNDNIKDGLYFY